jgi:hypothetical protein
MFEKEQFFGKWIVGLAKRNNQLESLIGKNKEQSDVMVVKAVRRKSNKEILFVEAGEDFANFIFSLPFECMDNFYSNQCII